MFIKEEKHMEGREGEGSYPVILRHRVQIPVRHCQALNLGKYTVYKRKLHSVLSIVHSQKRALVKVLLVKDIIIGLHQVTAW